MTVTRLITLVAVLLFVTAGAHAAEPAKLILLTQSNGFVHDVVKRRDGNPSVVETIVEKIAKDSNLFTVDVVDDAAQITPQRLKDAKILMLYTTGDIPLDVGAVTDWIKQGGALVGIHCASDTLHGSEAYANLIDAEFAEHPWTAGKTVTIKVNDPSHPAAKPFAPEATFKEEIYRYKFTHFDAIHVLISLDMEKTPDIKRPYHVPIAWCKELGRGKVFYTSLGHNQALWQSDAYQQHLLGAIRWCLNIEKSDATPNPQVHEKEDQLAKAAVAATQPSQPSQPSVNH